MYQRELAVRIPDDLMPLVRELAEDHLARAAGDLRLIESHRAPDHRDRGEAERRLALALRLDSLVNPRRRVA